MVTTRTSTRARRARKPVAVSKRKPKPPRKPVKEKVPDPIPDPTPPMPQEPVVVKKLYKIKARQYPISELIAETKTNLSLSVHERKEVTEAEYKSKTVQNLIKKGWLKDFS